MTGPPDLYQYLDYRPFLRDWIKEKIRANPDYRRTRLARRAGLSNSHLVNVVTGERDLLGDDPEKLAKALRLEDHLQTQFLRLVRYTQSTSPRERAALLRELMEAQVEHGVVLPELAHVVLANFDAFRIYALADAHAFRDDPAWIAEVLRIPEPVVERVLRMMKEFKLLVQDASGRWTKGLPSAHVVVPTESGLQDQLDGRALETAARHLEHPTAGAHSVGGVAPVSRAALPDLVEQVAQRTAALLDEIAALEAEARQHPDGPTTLVMVPLLLVPVVPRGPTRR